MDGSDLRTLSAKRTWALIVRVGRDKDERESLLALVYAVCLSREFNYKSINSDFDDFIKPGALRELLHELVAGEADELSRFDAAWSRLIGVLVAWARAPEWRVDPPKRESVQKLYSALRQWLPDFADEGFSAFLNELYLQYRGSASSRSAESVFCAALAGGSSRIAESTTWSGDVVSEASIRSSGSPRLIAPSGAPALNRGGVALWWIRLRGNGVQVQQFEELSDFHVIEGASIASNLSRWSLPASKNGKWIEYIHEIVSSERVVVLILASSSLQRPTYRRKLSELASRGWIHAVVAMPNNASNSGRVVLIISKFERSRKEILLANLSSIPDGLSLGFKDKAELGGLIVGRALGFERVFDVGGSWRLSSSVEKIVKREGLDELAADSGLVEYINDKNVLMDPGLLIPRAGVNPGDGQNVFSPIRSDQLWRDISSSLAGCFYVIGDNGEGKSFLLADLVRRFSSDGVVSVAIAFSANDRFWSIQSPVGGAGLYVYRGLLDAKGRANRRSFEIGLLKDLGAVSLDQERLAKLRALLVECGFYEEVYLLPRRGQPKVDAGFIEVGELAGRSASAYQPCFRRRLNEGEVVPFEELSSGEQHVVHLLLVVVRNMENGVIFFVDEPEISLHAKWQRLVPSLFSKMSNEFGVKFVVATHSPILIAGASDAAGVVYSASAGRLEEMQLSERKSVGRALLDGFNVYTPGSLDLYEDCARIVSGAVEACNDGMPTGQRIDLAISEIDRLARLVVASKGQVDELQRAKDMELLSMARLAIGEISNHSRSSDHL